MATENDLTIYGRYAREFASLPGWFYQESVAIWDILLTFQAQSVLEGNLLEIGVWRGKSATLMALHAKPENTCVFVDPEIPEPVRALIGKIKSDHVIYAEMKSSGLFRTPLLAGYPRSFRWIHIDGEHSGPAVINDLDIARILLSEEGVIAIDDFFSPAFPQITGAVFKWLAAHPLEFELFLVGYNKGYLCRHREFARYGGFLKDRLHAELRRRISRPLTVWKSTHPADMNCFGIWERAGDKDYCGPDWDPSSIQI